MTTNSYKQNRILMVQLAVLLYSMVSVLSKVAAGFLASDGIFSASFILCIGGMLAILGIYAILWQKILSLITLSIAYVNKAFVIFWSMIWSVLLFHESVTFNNVLGVVCVLIGVVLVSSNE